MRRGFHACLWRPLQDWIVSLMCYVERRGFCSIKVWQFKFVCVNECHPTYHQSGEEKFEENLSLNWWKYMKKSELTSPPWNQTLFQLLLSLNKDNEHKLAEKNPLWQAHLVSHSPPPSHNQLIKKFLINPESLKYFFHRVRQGRHRLRDSSDTL